MYWRLSFSLFILSCLAVSRWHPSASHLTTPNPLIQNHVSYWSFPALVPQRWWDYCRISHQVRGFVGSASCCIAMCVFICLFRHEAHVNSSHRQWLASILSPFQSVRVQIQPVPQRSWVQRMLCLLIYAEKHRPFWHIARYWMFPLAPWCCLSQFLMCHILNVLLKYFTYYFICLKHQVLKP